MGKLRIFGATSTAERDLNVVYETATYDYVGILPAGTNFNLVFGPNGTGYWSTQEPDGAATGGNARGTGSVDFQFTRTAATQVASGNNAFLVAGFNNTASGNNSAVVGGTSNLSSGARSAVVGGTSHIAAADDSIILGGNDNDIISGAIYSGIVGGSGHDIGAAATYAFIGGGNNCDITGAQGANVGGNGNLSSAIQSGNFAGESNQASGTRSVNVGGTSHISSGIDSGCFAGNNGTASNTYAVTVGGQNLTASQTHAACVGGLDNTATNNYAGVFCGNNNDATSDNSVILGGLQHSILANCDNAAIIGGGHGDINGTVSDYGVIVGGLRNAIDNDPYAIVLGGASGLADHTGLIVFSSNSEAAALSGDTQRGKSQGQLLHYDQRTTADAATPMDSIGAEYTVPNLGSVSFEGILTAVDETAAAGSRTSAWRITVVAENTGAAPGTTTIRYSNVTALVDEIGGGGVVAAPVVTVNSPDLRINVDANSANATRWSWAALGSRAVET